MAYPVPPNSILEVRLYSQQAQQTFINVWHYQNNAGMIQDGADAARQALVVWRTQWEALIKQTTSVSFAQIQVTAQWITPNRYVAEQLLLDGDGGVLPGAPVTTGAAVVIRRRSQRAGKKFRGRVYFGGAAIVSITNSVLNADGVLTWNALTAPMIQGLLIMPNNVNLDQVIWSAKNPQNVSLVSSAALDTVIRYQRRREVGRGI